MPSHWSRVGARLPDTLRGFFVNPSRALSYIMKGVGLWLANPFLQNAYRENLLIQSAADAALGSLLKLLSADFKFGYL